MTFTRPAAYRNASLIKPHPARVLGDAVAELAHKAKRPDPLRTPGETALPDAEPAAASSRSALEALSLCPRPALPSASDSAAARDPRFIALVAEADAHRDAGAWREAEQAYGAALALYPYQSGYWVQQGHMRKEQGRHAAAEIAYRTAAALGAPPGDVAEHARFVIERQDESERRFPLRFAVAGETARLVPAQPDVLLLARLLWREDWVADERMLALLREFATLDALFAAMVDDPCFGRANVEWLALVGEGELEA